MDDFEKHIKANRVLFDEHTADKAKIWANIEAKLEQKKPKVIPIWKSPMAKIAAGILIIIGVFGIIGESHYDFKTIEPSSSKQELGDIDMHYKNLLSVQIQLVKNNPKLSDEDKVEFLSFMDDLDEEYRLLKMELDKNLDNQLVLEAIVANYKKRIELIENLLEQLNDSNIKKEDYGYTI